MSRFLIVLSIVAGLIIIVDLYCYKGFWLLSSSWTEGARKLSRILYWIPTIITLLLFGSVAAGFDYFMANRMYGFFYFVTGFAFLFFLPKLFFAVFHLFDDISHLFRLSGNFVASKVKSEPVEHISRFQFLTQVGAGASLLVFGGMLYGLTRGKFAFRVIEQEVALKGLPDAFVGARIVHISDMHLGSFLDNYDEVRRAITMINELEADYIFFTGDMVNNYAHEAEPWIEIVGALKAKQGKYSILGNHDYGDYVQWENEDDKKANLKQLEQIQKDMGFRLLRNESTYLVRDGQKIALAGMENWGSGFAKYGDLKKTMEGLKSEDCVILLSHDPSHWEKEVMSKQKVELTLAGHTHGMQFGVEIPSLNIKFSPARMRYKRWGGLYTEGEQNLYVNRGFGFLGFPGRVGIWPEITLLELKQA
jgi:uncharacterized protein